jgi:hypothetical protein
MIHLSSPTRVWPGCTALYCIKKDRSGEKGRNVGAIYRWRLVGSTIVCVCVENIGEHRYMPPVSVDVRCFEFGILYSNLGPMGLGFWMWIRSRVDRIGFSCS